jgi:hypothetical protein
MLDTIKMLTQSIITAKHVRMNSMITPSKAAANCVAHVLNSMDHAKYMRTIESAMAYPDQIYTLVLFEYTHSGINDTIAQVERMPGTTTSIHDTLKDSRCVAQLNELFIVNSNMRLFTRRKFDFNKPFGREQITNIRQLVLRIDPYAFTRQRVMSEDSYVDMPDLAPL